MEILILLPVCALVFGVCFLVDKGFTKLFRSQAQHRSGKAVRLNKRYGSFGLILTVLGVASVLSGINGTVIMIVAGSIIIAMGLALVIYYMTFGIYYDEDSFLVTNFGKKSRSYRYEQIRGQQLYITGKNIVVELYLEENQTVFVQLQMEGSVEFLNCAFRGWCQQKWLMPEDCQFHDPDNSCWFPPMKEEQ